MQQQQQELLRLPQQQQQHNNDNIHAEDDGSMTTRGGTGTGNGYREGALERQGCTSGNERGEPSHGQQQRQPPPTTAPQLQPSLPARKRRRVKQQVVTAIEGDDEACNVVVAPRPKKPPMTQPRKLIGHMYRGGHSEFLVLLHGDNYLHSGRAPGPPPPPPPLGSLPSPPPLIGDSSSDHQQQGGSVESNVLNIFDPQRYSDLSDLLAEALKIPDNKRELLNQHTVVEAHGKARNSLRIGISKDYASRIDMESLERDLHELIFRRQP